MTHWHFTIHRPSMLPLSPPNKRILIVGAGLAGLALALRQRGMQAYLIERHANWLTHGAGIYLLGNAMRCLQSLGLSQAVPQHGATPTTQTLYNHRGKKLAVCRS